MPPRTEVAEFRRREASSRRWNDMTGLAIGAIVVIAVLVGGIPLLGILLNISAGGFQASSLVFPAVVFGAATLAVLLARQIAWASWSRRLRLHRFAEANGFRYDEPGTPIDYPGSAFSVGSSRSCDARFSSVDVPLVEFGSYQWTVGSGKSRQTYRIGYAAMLLERPLPHMVLDARGNNGFFGAGIIPFAFDRDQVFSLEGDFDRHFTLYCPSRYERDALYIFTPDVMALLIDESSLLDVEIVDDWVFFYATTPFDFTEPREWRRLFRLHDTLVAKLHRASGRYRDDRVSGQDPASLPGAALPGALGLSSDANPSSGTSGPATTPSRRYVVGPGGRRLRRGTPWLAIIGAVVIGIVWIAAQLIR